MDKRPKRGGLLEWRIPSFLSVLSGKHCLGPIHWAHAISADLVRWEHLPIALYPCELGTIFSGSAVIDHDNTSGLGKEGTPPTIAIYTNHHAEREQADALTFKHKALRTALTKDAHVPNIIKTPYCQTQASVIFRDPKVI